MKAILRFFDNIEDTIIEKEFLNKNEDILLKTIYVPKNLLYLADALPKANYDGYRSVDGIRKDFGNNRIEDDQKLP
jgi:hypothetical protein